MTASRPNWQRWGKTMDALRDSLDFAPRDSIKEACMARDPVTGRVGLAVRMRSGAEHAIIGVDEKEALEGMAGRIDYLHLQANQPAEGYRAAADSTPS